MKTMYTRLALMALLLLPAFLSGQGSGSVENGKKLFLRDGCYECHGYAGQGGAGVRIAPKVIALQNFIKYVRNPTGAMPPYTAKVASDQDLTDIRAFLATIPEPPPAKNIPLLNQ